MALAIDIIYALTEKAAQAVIICYSSLNKQVPKPCSWHVNRWVKTENWKLQLVALMQVRNQGYDREIVQYPDVKAVVECGIAFSGKEVVAAYPSYHVEGRRYDDEAVAIEK